MNILIIHPTLRRDESPRHIPHLHGILANIVDMLGHQVAVMDLNAFRIPPEAVRYELGLQRWDVIAIGGDHTQYKDIKLLLKLVKQVQPHALIVGFGGFLSYTPVDTMRLNPEIEVGCIGDPEETFQEVLDEVYRKYWRRIRGIVFREDNGILLTPPRPPVEIERVPWPAYHFLPLEVYFQNSPLPHSPEAMNCKRRIDIAAERPGREGLTHLQYSAIYGGDIARQALQRDGKAVPPHRAKSSREIVEHVKDLRIKYAIDFVSFLDENLCADRGRLAELCDLWIEEGLHSAVKWGCFGDVRTVSYDLLRKMKDAGCSYIIYNVESASDRALESEGREIRQEQEQRALEQTLNAGISPVFTFIIGLPSEDINDLLEDVWFWIRNKVECEPTILTPMPGTPFYYRELPTIASQYDERLSQLGGRGIQLDKGVIEQWRLEAVEKFFSDISENNELTAVVNKTFDFGDLLALKALMKAKDIARILKLSHLRLARTGREGWRHDPKWRQVCPVCLAEAAFNELSEKVRLAAEYEKQRRGQGGKA